MKEQATIEKETLLVWQRRREKQTWKGQKPT
jgi:hypothetical protein